LKHSLPSLSLLAAVVAVCAAPAAHAADPSKGSLAIGTLTQLDPATNVDALVMAAAPLAPESSPPGPTRGAVVWSTTGHLEGSLLSTDDDPLAIALTTGTPLRARFDADGNLLVATRGSSATSDPLGASLLDELGHVDDTWSLGTVAHGAEAAVDFLPSHDTFVALTGADDAIAIREVDSDGTTLRTRSLDPIAGTAIASGLQVSVHDAHDILVGWDRFSPCGSSVRHESLIARLDDELVLVNGGPRRFASGGCGATAKRLAFLDGPSDVGSLAIFADRSARRFVTGQPPPSQTDFRLTVAKGEAIAAVAMDENGRLMVVTRTTAAQKPVRLYVQGFGRDGKARTGKIVVDGTVGGAGFAPDVAAAIADDGAAWIAFTRDADGRSGLFLRQLTVHLP